jgi:hypothetical protein
MPRIRLTTTAIDALPTSKSDVVYWDAGYPGFGVKVTPKGRKVFIVLYRTAGAGSKLRKYTIGSYGRVTLHQARVAAARRREAWPLARGGAGDRVPWSWRGRSWPTSFSCHQGGCTMPERFPQKELLLTPNSNARRQRHLAPRSRRSSGRETLARAVLILPPASSRAFLRWRAVQASFAPFVEVASPLDSGRFEIDNYVMDVAVLHDTTALAFEIVANDQDGMRVELQTIGEAARFICSQFSGPRAEAVDWKHAAVSLEAACRNAALVRHATEAVHSLLETEGMLTE